MSEWEVFGIVAALAAFVISIATPIIKLNTTITKLTVIVDKLAQDLSALTSGNEKVHQKFNERIEDHETRITILERLNKHE